MIGFITLLNKTIFLKKQRKPVILREIGGLSVNQQIALPVQYGALACILARKYLQLLKRRRIKAPVTGLMQVDTDQIPLIDEWIQEYGIEFWLEKLLTNAYFTYHAYFMVPRSGFRVTCTKHGTDS